MKCFIARKTIIPATNNNIHEYKINEYDFFRQFFKGFLYFSRNFLYILLI